MVSQHKRTSSSLWLVGGAAQRKREAHVMVAYRPKRICAGQESEEEGGGRWCPDREQGDAAGPLSGPRRQRPECPSFLGVGCCASRRLRTTTTTTVGPALRLLAQRECRDLCVKPDSTAAVAVARRKRNRNRRRGRGRRRKARGAESRQDGTETWMQEPGQAGVGREVRGPVRCGRGC